MLALPDHITACLFDLDGVLTQTAKVHAAAWKQSFDEYLRERSARTGEPFVAFDLSQRLRQLRRRQAATRRRALVPRVAGDRGAGGRPVRPVRRPRPSTASGSARTSSCCACSMNTAVAAYEGSVGYVTRRASRAQDRGRVVEQELPARSCHVGRHRRSVRRARSTASSPSASISPASRRPTPISPPPGRSASSRPTPPCSRTRSPASRPAGPGTSAASSASIASARPGAARPRRRHRGRRSRRSCWSAR